jgi:hypothetical protein
VVARGRTTDVGKAAPGRGVGEREGRGGRGGGEAAGRVNLAGCRAELAELPPSVPVCAGSCPAC